jgi:NAD(P)-dependent dehydrogenase (short-subunit alcohol dehydrogenase family)
LAQFPLGGCHQDEVGCVAASLLSPAALYVNGVIMAVDGGMIRALL